MESGSVIRLRIRFPAFVVKTLQNGTGGWVDIEKQVSNGTTVLQLLKGLATVYPGFREGLFNPDTGTVGEQIGVVLNNQLLTFAEMTQTKISNNDSLVILPIYSGG